MSIQPVIDAIRASGPTGISADDIARIAIGRARTDRADNNRVHRTIEHARYALRATKEEILSSTPGSRKTRYFIAGARETRSADHVTKTSIPSVSRRISGDLGLGATPGAIVSVARVSFLDGHP